MPKKSFSLYQHLNQHSDYEPADNHIKFKLNAFVKLENIEEDFSKLPFVNEKIIFPIKNASSRGNIKFTQEQADFLLQHRIEDFEMFGYDKKIPESLLS